MIVWLLAVAGSALVLTQSSITAPMREWLLARESFLGKLVSCPMCSGFWLGALWGVFLLPLTIPAATGPHWFPMCIRIVANGFGGSIVSALAVAAWLALSEAQAISYLWRSRNSAPVPGTPKMHVPLKMRPAFINGTSTIFFCACGEAVPAGCVHSLTERCGAVKTEIHQEESCETQS